jgi:hypothetical protein
VYGRARDSVFPNRKTQASPRLSDTTGASDFSSLSRCMPMRASAS